MVWISVHETVMVAKLRRLAKALGCSQNEALGILVRLWLWGMHNANEAGETDASKEDIADVLNVGLSKLLEPEKVSCHDIGLRSIHSVPFAEVSS